MTDPQRERTIPILPCVSIDDQLAFYGALGFVVAYRQKVPNVYASVQRGGIELQFFVLKGYEPASSYSTCYVLVPAIDALYADFRDGLKRRLGRVPIRGIPRIGALKDMSYGVRQFLMTDPGGNIIRIGQPIDGDAGGRTGAGGRLEKALDAAFLLADSKGDPRTAARVLDAALSDEPGASATLVVSAKLLRADVAAELGDDQIAKELLAEISRIPLDDGQRDELADQLARADDLRRTLG